MLHIILGILKITGIIIGLLFLLLLCILFAVVLIPVRYRARVELQGKGPRANICLSWLLHIVSVKISGEAGRKTSVVIKVFGFRLPVFGERDTKSEERTSPRRSQKENTPKYDDKLTVPEEKFREDESDDRNADGINTDGVNTDDINANDISADDICEDTIGTDDISVDAGLEKKDTKKIFFSGLKKAVGFIGSLKEKIIGLRRKISRLRQKIAKIKEKPAFAMERLSGLMKMAGEYEIREVSQRLIRETLYLISHYRPRRISGYLNFGTGDPASTGELTGLIYLLLPARADRFVVTPDFYEARFETEVDCKGYIRTIHALRVVLHGFRDKKLRRLIRKVRHR